MKIIPANVTDAPLLTNITKSSKAYWPYPSELLERWADELAISSEYIQQNLVFIAWSNENKAIGYYSLDTHEGERIKMENLFILPEYIGKGIGTALLKHAMATPKKLDCTNIWLESDPHAAGFYLQKGFTVIGQKASSVIGRYLPVLQRHLTESL